jgi:hypothetical protein
MAGADRDLDNLSRVIGRIEEQIKTLFKRIDALEENSTREHRVVHDIVEATSDAVRTLTAKVDEMKPLTDDYREKRAEARGAAKLAYTLYALVGGIVGSVITWAIQLATFKPPH